MGLVSRIVGIGVPLILGWVLVVPAVAAAPADREVDHAIAFRARMGFPDGDTLCRSGAGPDRVGRPAWDCGELINKCAAKWTADAGVTPRWKISCAGVVAFDSVAGDSGAPYVRKVTDTEYAAVGIHSHSSTTVACDNDSDACRSWFTRMNVIEDPFPDLEFRVCTSAGC